MQLKHSQWRFMAIKTSDLQPMCLMVSGSNFNTELFAIGSSLAIKKCIYIIFLTETFLYEMSLALTLKGNSTILIKLIWCPPIAKPPLLFL